MIHNRITKGVAGLLALIVVYGLIRFLLSDFFMSIIPAWHTHIPGKPALGLFLLFIFVLLFSIGYLSYKVFKLFIHTIFLNRK